MACHDPTLASDSDPPGPASLRPHDSEVHLFSEFTELMTCPWFVLVRPCRRLKYPMIIVAATQAGELDSVNLKDCRQLEVIDGPSHSKFMAIPGPEAPPPNGRPSGARILISPPRPARFKRPWAACRPRAASNKAGRAAGFFAFSGRAQGNPAGKSGRFFR